jgi:nucleoside-diphosphate-sugar epimerase
MEGTHPRVPMGEPGHRQLLGRGDLPLGDRCLVTGGAGFVGSNLVHALVRQGMAVRVFDDLSSGSLVSLDDMAGEAEFVEGDVRDLEAVWAAAQGCTTVFHLAAMTSTERAALDPGLAHAVNATGTHNVLTAARDAGCLRVIVASSAAIYGQQDALPLQEELLPRPSTIYAATRVAAEASAVAFHAEYDLATVILRLFNVFGPRQDPGAPDAPVVARFIAAALDGEPMTIDGDGEQSRDFVYVGDAVQAMLLAVDSTPDAWGRPYNVALGDRHTVNALADLVGRLVPGVHPSPVHGPARAEEVGASHADVRAAERVLGYSPEYDFEEAIGRTVRWYTDQRDLGFL